VAHPVVRNGPGAAHTGLSTPWKPAFSQADFTISSTDFLHRFEASAFPPVHGRTGYGFEAAATSFIEDGASDQSFGCLRSEQKEAFM